MPGGSPAAPGRSAGNAGKQTGVETSAEPHSPKRKLDLTALALLPAGVAVVLLAQVLEGGAARSLLHGPAALIVFGGTLGAILVSFSPREVGRAVRAVARTFDAHDHDHSAVEARLVDYAVRAHRKGVLVLDDDVDGLEDPFLRNGLALVVDGASLVHLRDVLAVTRAAQEADEDGHARVFDAAAGYAPTLGILGAVLGLIQVMERLSEPGALGAGIAVAFVATVYGVGAANLMFLPIAGRLRERATATSRRRDVIAEGLYAIHQRMPSRMVAQRLRAALGDKPAVEQIAARLAATAAKGRA